MVTVPCEYSKLVLKGEFALLALLVHLVADLDGSVLAVLAVAVGTGVLVFVRVSLPPLVIVPPLVVSGVVAALLFWLSVWPEEGVWFVGLAQVREEDRQNSSVLVLLLALIS
jgi:hypothetical protein